MAALPSSFEAQPEHVPETAFGKWFLKTRTWTDHVLERALKEIGRASCRERV